MNFVSGIVQEKLVIKNVEKSILMVFNVVMSKFVYMLKLLQLLKL